MNRILGGGGSGQAREYAPENTQRTFSDSLMSELDSVYMRLKDAITRAANIADRAFGSMPRDPKKDNPSPVPVHFTAAIAHKVGDLQILISDLEGEITRLDNL